MKNSNFLIIGVIAIGFAIAAVAGGVYLLNQNNSEDIEKTASNDAMMMEENEDSDSHSDGDAMMNDEDKMMMEEGASSSKYITHTKGIVESTNGSERVLYFYANWCPTCRPVDKELQENASNLPDGITVIRVNYNDPDTEDEEDDLAKLYGVNYQHTFVHIDEEGNEISTWSGGGLEELLENI